MIKVIKDIQLTENFYLSEFICKEGKNEVYIKMDMVNKLQELREALNKPIQVVSGYRSPAYNKKIGGAKNSRHIHGEAADIKVRGMKPYDVAVKAREIGFDGIGIYETWVHVDTRGHRARWGKWERSGNVTYDKRGSTDIMYVDPLDLRFAKIGKMAWNVQHKNFINGMQFGKVTVGTGYSEGKKITPRLPWDNKPRGTFIVHKNGSVTVERLVDPENKYDDIWFCVQNAGLNPIDLYAEGWPGNVGRKTNCIMIGYNPGKKKAVLTHKPASDIARGKLTLRNLGCVDKKGDVLGIRLDSGTPATFVYDGKVKEMGGYLDNIIYV